MINYLKKVIIGGTFDVLHKGHRAFMQKAFSLGEVTIGLTSDKMAQRNKKRKVNKFQYRKKELQKFFKKNSFKKAKVIKIENKFGPAIKEDFNFIVVSPATHKTALLINKKRIKAKKIPIKIVKINFVLAEDGKPISASRIIKGRINKNGKLIKRNQLCKAILTTLKK